MTTATVPAGALGLPGDLEVPLDPRGVVVFAHGSGSSRRSPRNVAVARTLNGAGLATLLFDLLTEEEASDRSNVFDIALLARRLGAATAWLRERDDVGGLPVGIFGASTGAAAALVAGAGRSDVAAVVCRGGRPDLAGEWLPALRAPTLLIVGGDDEVVLELNREARARMRCESRLVVIPGATHLFEEPGALEEVARLAADWFVGHLGGSEMVEYDSRTALLVVDVQNDFADPEGSLWVPGAGDILPTIDAEIGRARPSGALIVYTQDWHPEHTPHFQSDGGIWPVHCVRDTWGAELHPGLDVVPDAAFVRKGAEGQDGYSAFSVRDPKSGQTEATVLDSILRAHGIEGVVIVGLATDYCVKESALDATARGFQTTVLRSAVRPVDLQPDDGARAFDAMREAGVRLE